MTDNFNFTIDTALLDVQQRKHEIRTLEAPAVYVRQRMTETIARLNLAGVLTKQVEAANEALCAFVELCYLADTDGDFANIDRRTYRLLRPAPWGRAGYNRWGLRQHEATKLRHILMERLKRTGGKQLPPLFDYGNGVWYLNTRDYPEIARAKLYLQRKPVTLVEWRCDFRTRV